jgi:hypothetical protein
VPPALAEPEPPIGRGEQHHPAIRGDSPAVEGGGDFLARDRWQVKGQRPIIVHGELVAPQSLCACCIGDRIMPRLRVSDYFRLITRADEVIE